jgi:hypothetical protein
MAYSTPKQYPEFLSMLTIMAEFSVGSLLFYENNLPFAYA